MIRFIIRKREGFVSGGTRESFYTIDQDSDELEKALNSGGYNEHEYAIHELIGVELIAVPASQGSER